MSRRARVLLDAFAALHRQGSLPHFITPDEDRVRKLALVIIGAGA